MYKLISNKKTDNCLKFVFTNNNVDRFYLEILNPKYSDGNENYFIVTECDKVIWSYKAEEMSEDIRTRVFIYDENVLEIIGDINL